MHIYTCVLLPPLLPHLTPQHHGLLTHMVRQSSALSTPGEQVGGKQVNGCSSDGENPKAWPIGEGAGSFMSGVSWALCPL